MIGKARENWHRFKESKPGHRFQDHHRRQQEGGSGRLGPRAILGIVGGILVVVGGVIAVPGPGPGWLIILLGLGMIAGESLPAARFLDWVEVRLRASVRRSIDTWTNSPAGVKGLIFLTILICVAASGYGIYYLAARYLF